MIIFKSISWKNFLSTGNTPNKVDLNTHSTTLIVGKNGEGKSTILDALCFALFNKPFRDVNKKQLVNSINQKNCVVEVQFSIGPIEYKVIRGMKPNLFDIFANGTLVNQDAASKDYQKVLEQQILKLNYKTFTQVVILGSASFVPFMQLPAGQRREVIEDILDITVFSTMNDLLKEKMVETKNDLKAIETEIRILTEQAKAQQSLLKSLESNHQQNLENIQAKIEKNRIEIDSHLNKIRELTDKATELTNRLPNEQELKQNTQKVSNNLNTLNHKINLADTNISFFNENEICPQCEQGISHSHKTVIIDKLKTEKDNYTKLSESALLAQETLTKQMNTLNELLNQIKDININISTENSSIKLLQNANTEYEVELNQASQKTNIEPEKDKLKQIAEIGLGKNNEKVKLQADQKLQDIASLLLRDTGIKTQIIKQYLPVMNKLINRYLTAMDFFVKFELDEAFNETIKSRFRDEFTYASFSEGEKMRIDLAILFTWRQIAKMKNSVNTNLLLLDEIFDSSLDVAGTDYFLTVMNQLGENSNIFVISHKGDVLLDKFRHNIKFVKHNDFSTIQVKD